jgi:broad specificity phosphatase PhoE
MSSLSSAGLQIVPEFSFLDARGVGELERLPLSEVAAALEAGDALAPTWRPAPNVDGTVHESSADVLVRVRQLLSLLETQYNGDTVVIVSPDSDNLSVLQAAVLGVDLRSHHTYAFAPGEARRLELATGERPEPPTSFACPRPPQCI